MHTVRPRRAAENWQCPGTNTSPRRCCSQLHHWQSAPSPSKGKSKFSRATSTWWLSPLLQSHPRVHPPELVPRVAGNSLIAPVQAGGDVALHILHPVMGEVPHQHLPPQIQDFIHDMPQSVEEITFISLGNTQMRRFSGQTRRHGVTTEEQRASPVYPLCAGHSEDRLSINKLSPLALKRTHFSTSFHPVSRCCSPAQESKPNFISQAPQNTHHVTGSWWRLHTRVWPDLWLYILCFPFHLKSSFFSSTQFYCPSRLQLTSTCLRKSSLTALAHMLFSLLWSMAACNQSQFKGKSYFSITSCVLILMLYCCPSEAGYIEDSNAHLLINFHC